MRKAIKTHFVNNYAPDKNAKVELKNGNLIDVENGDSFKSGVSIIIQNRKILEMPGSIGESDIKPDYSIDLQGKTVVPSLFNTHCHTSMTSPTLVASLKDIRLSHRLKDRQSAKNMADCLSRGITNIRDCYTEDLRVTGAMKERIASGEIPGPRIMQAVVVGPTGSYLNENYGFLIKLMRSKLGLPSIDREKNHAGCVSFSVNASTDQVRDAVDIAIDERGAEVIKIGEQLENMTDLKPNANIIAFDQLAALTDQARKRGIRTTIHQVSVDTFRRAVKAGVSSLAHIPRDETLTQKDIDDFLAAGLIIEPTQSVAYDVSWKVKDNEWANHPEMEALSLFRNTVYTLEDLAAEFYLPEFKETLRKTNENLNNGKFKMLGVIDLSNAFRFYASIIGPGVDNLRMLFENGAVIGLANDGGVPPCTPAMIGLELMLQDRTLKGNPNGKQLDGKTALRIATINSAKAMGIDDQFGTIERGKSADLVIFDGNPLKDYTLIGSPVSALFMDGKLVVDNIGLKIEPT